MEYSNPPQDISSYTPKENEVKIIRPRYDPQLGEFKGFNETIGYLVVRRSPEEVFFNYGYDREKSKVLYAHYRRRIPNSFSGTIFKGHNEMIESGEADGEGSRIYFFLPSIIDRSEEINKYLNNMSIFSVYVTQSQPDACGETKFEHLKPDLFGMKRRNMGDACVKCFEHINEVSNNNLVRNTDSLLARKGVEIGIDLVGENKNRVPPQIWHTL